ncbi:MAG: PAS domain S-box protein [Spirosomataceae bacterium]
MTTEKNSEELQNEIEKLRKQLEQAGQRKGIDQLQDLVDNTSDLIMLFSLSGRFLFVNRAFREITGYSSDEISRLSFNDIVHPKYKENTLANLDKILKGEKITDFETVIYNKDQKRVYLSGSVNCRFDGDKPVAFRCILHDISQRYRAERSEKLYYSIAQQNLNQTDLYEFLKGVHVELQKTIQANNFFVALYDTDKSFINFPYYVNEQFDENLKFTKRRLGNGIIEHAIVKNKPLLFYREDIEKMVENKEVVLYEKIPEIILFVPLRVGERTTGVIGVQSYSDRNKFTIRDLELLEFISGQIALALARKQTEQERQRQTARLNAIFDSSSHMIWTMNRRFQLSSFNKNYSNLIQSQLGTPPQVNVSTEKVGWRLIAPSDRPVLQEKYNSAFKGIPQYFEMNWGKIDGGDQWFEFYLNPILPSDGGQIEEVSGIARDITEKKMAQLSLQKSENKFRDIVESFLDIYYRTDLAGNVTMISPSVLEHTGYSSAEVLGNKVDKFFENASDSSKNIKGLLKAGSITNFEVKVKRQNGELRDFILNIRLIRNEDGVPVEVEGVARDISELKKTAQEMLKAKEEAEHSLKVKERFLANMSHEIRTPMNGIIGMIDLLNETNLNVEQKDYVQTIKKSSETLLTILNDILDLSKIEAGKMELHNAPLDIRELLDRLVSLFRQRAIEKNNKVAYQLSENFPPYLIADQTRLLQILSNLTSNALKFTENGTVNISLSVVSSNGKIHQLKVEVTDSGIGISPENQKLLFGAFQQLDNSTKKSFGGTGLGLAISRELCRLMKGDMGVISEEGKGSTFWFTVELRSTTISPSVTESLREEVKLTDFFKGYSPKILLVDDNAVNRKVASEILQKAGCEVTTADSGMRAIEIVGMNSSQEKGVNAGFDVILMDIQMPEMDGVETTKRLRQQFGESLPTVIAMTAYSMQHDRERFLAAGMDDYIPKPIRANVLIQKVDEIVKKGKEEKAARKAGEGKKENELINVSSENPKSEIQNPNFDYVIPSDIPMIDAEIVSQLKEMVGEELLMSVFEDFEREAEEQIANTKQAYPDNVKTIQAELHTLKGNSGTIGLMRIHEIVKEIEVPSKTGDLTNFEPKMAILEKEFADFKEVLKNGKL